MTEFEFELQDVSIAYVTSSEHPVLNHIQLSVEKGCFMALVGQNGSGKSTLGRAIAGLTNISKGSIRRYRETEGSRAERGTQESVPSVSARVQMVFQNPDAQIVGTTIYEDICFGMENVGVPSLQMRHRAEMALERVGLTLPLDTPVDVLSGGQKQLLCIAGCLVMEPSTIVFDEVTSMLDPEGRRLVLQTVRQLHELGLTVIWITQWMDEVKDADQVIALDGGVLVFEGSPQDFFYRRQNRSLTSDTSPCRALGFQPPYIVQVAEGLMNRGFTLVRTPLSEDELIRTVEELCQSK